MILESWLEHFFYHMFISGEIPMTTATRPPTFFFSTTNPNNPHAIARAKARRAAYDTWVGAMPSLQADINTTALSLVAAWSLPEGHIKSGLRLSLIHISEPTRPVCSSRMPSSA